MNIRHHIALFALLILSGQFSVSAQPVLTADNFPQQLLAQEVTINQFEAVSPGDLTATIIQTGENQTWDISAAEFGDVITATFTFQEPPFDDLPAGDIFATADPVPNFAYVTTDIVDPDQFPEPVELAFYHHVNEERSLNIGFAGMLDADEDGDPDLVFFAYDPPKVEYNFPTEFGDTWTNDVEQVFQAVGIGSFRTNLLEVNEVVGWGTLVTPMGSVEVLQIRQDLTTTAFGISTPGITSLQFLAPFQEVSGKANELVSLQATASLSLDGTTVTSVSYSSVELDGGGGNPTAVEDADEVPAGFQIHQNFPNPFNPSTMIEYSVEQTGDVLMTVHDMLGREVGRVVDGVVTAGTHSVRWDAGSLPSGLYQVRMSMEGQVAGRSMILQK